jgi:hypothetical protein
MKIRAQKPINFLNMKRKSKRTILLMALSAAMGINLARAQTITPNVINANGGSFSGGNLNFSWSVGEMAIQTYSASGNILTEGLLQPEPVIVSGINDYVTQGDITVFPNPFSDKIWIRWTNTSPVVRVSIFSMTGQKVYDNTFDGNAIDAANLMPGMYILFAYGKDDNEYSSFKILKD